MLGKSQTKILEWLKEHGPATAAQVGRALYDSTSACAGQGAMACQTDLTRSNWARNVLKKMSLQHLVVVCGMDEKSKANLFAPVEVDHSIPSLSGISIRAIEAGVKRLLHASRDCMRNKKVDTRATSFMASDGYYGEAFGIMRALEILGHGYMGADNLPAERKNLKWWFLMLSEQVLQEENFQGSGECDFCVQNYGKDDAGRTRSV